MSANVQTTAGGTVPVDETELERRVLAGEVRPTSRVLVQNPRVGARWVQPDELQDALRSGFRIASDDTTHATELKEQYGEQEARAFAEGVARGATFGGSDWLARQAGVPAEALRLRAEYSPTAALGGELIGGVLPFLATGGVGGTITGARAAATGARGVARVLGEQALRGAAEGTIIGLGQAVSDAAMERDPLTMQKALASAGVGALFGGVLGGGVGTLGELGGRLLGRSRRAVMEGLTPEAPAVGPEMAAIRAAGEAVPGPEAAGRVAGEAVPPPPGAPPGVPPGAGAPPPPPPKPPGSILDDIATGVIKSALPIKEAIEKNPTFLRRVLDAFDIHLPSADEAVLRGLDIRKGQLAKLERKGLEEKAAAILRQDERFQKIRTLEDAAALIETKLTESGNAYGQSLSRLDELATAAERIDLNEVADTIRDQVLAKYRKGPAVAQSVGDRVESEIALLRQRANEGPKSLTEVEQIKRDYDPWARFNSNAPPAEMSQAQAFADIRRVVKKAVEDRADTISGRAGQDLAKKWKSDKEIIGAMSELADVAKDRLQARVSNRFFSLTDNLAGAAAAISGATLNPVGLGLSLSAAILNKWGRQNFPWVLAKALSQHEGSPGVRAAAEALQQAVKSVGPADAARAEAAFNRPITQAAVQGPEAAAVRRDVGPALVGFLRRAAEGTAAELWGAHLILSGSQEYREELARRGWDGFLLPEDDAEANAQGERVAKDARGRLSQLDAEAKPKARALLKLQERAQQLDKRVSGAAKTAVSGEPSVPRQRREAPAGAVKRLAELAERPEAFEAAVAQQLGPLPSLIPGAGGVAVETLGRAVQHLSSVAPKPPGGALANIPALAQPWIPNSLEVERFEQALEAVADPATVVEDLAAGQASPAAIQAVGAVYPELLEDFRSKVLEALLDQGQPLPYGQRVQLSLLLGQPLDESLQPAMLVGLQTAHTPPQEAPSARPPPPSMPPVSAGLTPSQRLSAKGAA